MFRSFNQVNNEMSKTPVLLNVLWKYVILADSFRGNNPARFVVRSLKLRMNPELQMLDQFYVKILIGDTYALTKIEDKREHIGQDTTDARIDPSGTSIF